MFQHRAQNQGALFIVHLSRGLGTGKGVVGREIGRTREKNPALNTVSPGGRVTLGHPAITSPLLVTYISLLWFHIKIPYLKNLEEIRASKRSAYLLPLLFNPSPLLEHATYK